MKARLLASPWAKLGAVAIPAFSLVGVASASGEVSLPPNYPWEWKARFTSYDYGAIRRGYQVYKEVCAACHSMERLCYRHLVGVTHTEEQAKAQAGEAYITDIDDQGNYIQRPGKLTDTFPGPYPNENAARAANNGALPPDLSLMAKARDGGADYIFALLCGYGRDIPEGMTIMDGQYFNPWFSGGALSMPQPIYDSHVEYEDGTPATIPQMAKDVSEFIQWSSDPNMDMSAMWTFNLYIAFTIWGAALLTRKRYIWNYPKTMKITWKPPGSAPH